MHFCVLKGEFRVRQCNWLQYRFTFLFCRMWNPLPRFRYSCGCFKLHTFCITRPARMYVLTFIKLFQADVVVLHLHIYISNVIW